MNFLFALFPGLTPYRLLIELAIVAAAVAAFLGWMHVHDSGIAEAARNEVRAEWNAEKAGQATAALAEAQSNAKETLRRLQRQQEAQNAHDQEVRRYQVALADARDARDGLQLDVDNLTAVARRAVSDSATAGERQAGAAAAGMLAELHRRADALAEVYAREADASRRAGALCERDYDALTVQK